MNVLVFFDLLVICISLWYRKLGRPYKGQLVSSEPLVLFLFSVFVFVFVIVFCGLFLVVGVGGAAGKAGHLVSGV